MTRENFFNQLKNELHYTDAELSKIESYSGLSKLLDTVFDSEKIFYVYSTFFSNDSLIAVAIRDDYLVVTNKRIIIIKKGWLGTLVEEYSLRKAHSIKIENNARIVIRESANSAPKVLVLSNEGHIQQLKELLYDCI